MADGVDNLKPIHFEQSVEKVAAPVAVVSKRSTSAGMKFLLTVMIVVSGIGSGFMLAQLFPATDAKSNLTNTPLDTNEIKVGGVYGDQDKSKFQAPAEGVLVKGGVDGEGSHHIMRLGGKSQNVYLTSSVLDLSLFENHKIEVYGETFASQKAGWLMDVGRIEVIELNAEKPFEEETSTALPEE